MSNAKETVVEVESETIKTKTREATPEEREANIARLRQLRADRAQKLELALYTTWIVLGVAQITMLVLNAKRANNGSNRR